MSLEFNEQDHSFMLDGIPLPSVTDLLLPLQEDGFKAINPAVLQAAANRGTAVHEITEAMDLDDDYEELIAPDLVPYVDAYEAFLLDHEVDWLGIESQVHFFDQYAGIVDRFGYIDGELCVLDIKTVQSPTVEQKVSVCCQLHAYEKAIKCCFEDVRGERFHHFALYLKKDGSYSLFNCDWFAETDDFKPADIWNDLYNSYEMKRLAKERLAQIKEKHRRKK